jgi:hypothetical protein
MAARWFQLDDFYTDVGDQQIFYPHLYARGYRLSAEQRAAMDSVLGPFPVPSGAAVARVYRHILPRDFLANNCSRQFSCYGIN